MKFYSLSAGVFVFNILFSTYVLAMTDSGKALPASECLTILEKTDVSKIVPPSDIYGEITGPVVMIGFGSIGKGVLPLLERHFKFDKKRMVVIDPGGLNRKLLDERGIKVIDTALSAQNYKEILTPLLKNGGGQGFCVNLSVDVGSVDVMAACRASGAFYIDTVVEPWAGFYFDKNLGPAARSNYALRETLLAEKAKNPDGPTAVSCCGANPGMVSWFVKQALMNLAKDLGMKVEEPKTREEWARLMQKTGVKGIHIAERDTQHSQEAKPKDTFVNTWSVDGFVSEGLQPAELGWGTFEKWMPENAGTHDSGCRAAIYLNQPGADTKVRTWCPTEGPQFGRLVTHNEAISIADYFTVGKGQNPEYRPTAHYAYRPADDAVLSIEEMFAKGKQQPNQHILNEKEIDSGIDELGVLLYGHAKNAYWYGSRLSIDEARALAPYQNATALQVTSAVIAGMVWALENPRSGIVEADEMDYKRCLQVQRPYLGPVEGHYTDWNPLKCSFQLFPDETDPNDPWQFKNVLVK
jgi:homospermidine synthase